MYGDSKYPHTGCRQSGLACAHGGRAQAFPDQALDLRAWWACLPAKERDKSRLLLPGGIYGSSLVLAWLEEVRKRSMTISQLRLSSGTFNTILSPALFLTGKPPAPPARATLVQQSAPPCPHPNPLFEFSVAMSLLSLSRNMSIWRHIISVLAGR